MLFPTTRFGLAEASVMPSHADAVLLVAGDRVAFAEAGASDERAEGALEDDAAADVVRPGPFR